MNPIVINGTVLCDPITGIPRFVYEVVTRLDPLLEGTGLDVRLCYRDDGRPLHLPELKNIKIVPLKAIKYSYNLVVLPRYLRKHHAFYVGLASDMLMTRRSVVRFSASSSGSTAFPPNGLPGGCSPSVITSAT